MGETAVRKRTKVIACEVLHREVCACAASSPLVLDIEFLPKGLHDLGQERMSSWLQETLGRVDPELYEATILCYGLCNNGTVGLSCPTKLAMPRAHDCITLLLGSRARYREFFDSHPGSYFKSPGWIERDKDPALGPESVVSQLGIGASREYYAELYGEENADYLAETLGDWLGHYERMVLIDTGVGDIGRYRGEARAEAERQSLAYEEALGDLGLLGRLLSGRWESEDFLVLEAGAKMAPSYDGLVIKAES
jgi:hypothetical protein